MVTNESLVVMMYVNRLSRVSAILYDSAFLVCVSVFFVVGMYKQIPISVPFLFLKYFANMFTEEFQFTYSVKISQNFTEIVVSLNIPIHKRTYIHKQKSYEICMLIPS